jgi:SAM-dependent methyltransferase
VAPEVARYDLYAEWYARWVGDGAALIASHSEMLPPLEGTRVLDVACGQGRMCRYLASQGAAVVGIDLSVAMLNRARTLGTKGIAYVHADAAQPPAWWDGRAFHGCTCELALMDIDNLAGALATVAMVLEPGGWFVASIVHPCFPGNDLGLSSYPPDRGYGHEGWWTSAAHNPDGARIRVGATHRTVSTYLNSLADAGLHFERLLEPPAPIPTFLLWRYRRPS